jgi:hypothetical protein
MLAINDFDGHIMPPFNRRNTVQERYGPPDKPRRRVMPITHQATWLLWGQNEVISEDFTAAVEPTFALYFALADWQPLKALKAVARRRYAPHAVRHVLGAFSHWGGSQKETLRYGWRSGQFAIGFAVAQYFDPSGFFLDHTMFGIAWESEDRFRLLETNHPYWRSDEPANHWDGTHSPFQQTAGCRDTAIVMFAIPEKDPWPDKAKQDRWLKHRNGHADQLTQRAAVRFPKSVDELVRDGKAFFVREGDVYVAIRTLRPGPELDKKALEHFAVIRSRSARTGFVFEVGTKSEHKSFEAFQTTVMNNPLKVKWDELTATYGNSAGHTLRMRYRPIHDRSGDEPFWTAPAVWINGRRRMPQDPAAWPVAETPSVTLKDGVLRIKQPEQRLIIDWRGDLPEIHK